MLSFMDSFAAPLDCDAVDAVSPSDAHSVLRPVITPVPGTVTPLDSVADPRLASGALGAGIAVIPDYDVDQVTVLAPASGELRRFLPHLFLIVTDAGEVVCTQLGIDTDLLDGTGFSPHVSEGDRVVAGERITTYSPRQLGRLGFDPVVSVMAVEHEVVSATLMFGEPCESGDVLFEF